MININFEDMFYTYVYQSPSITVEQLIAFIGGNFGLFIGISLLSLVEVIEIIFNLIFFLIKRAKLRKNEKENEDKKAIDVY